MEKRGNIGIAHTAGKIEIKGDLPIRSPLNRSRFRSSSDGCGPAPRGGTAHIAADTFCTVMVQDRFNTAGGMQIELFRLGIINVPGLNKKFRFGAACKKIGTGSGCHIMSNGFRRGDFKEIFCFGKTVHGIEHFPEKFCIGKERGLSMDPGNFFYHLLFIHNDLSFFSQISFNFRCEKSIFSGSSPWGSPSNSSGQSF